MNRAELIESKCFYCREGHKPMISQSAVEHWVVTRVLPAKVTIKPCKDPEHARTALLRALPEEMK